jgi:hypothetical protein
VDEALPLFPPLQLTSAVALAVTPNEVVGCVILTVALAVHPLLSVTVMVYVPAVNPVLVELLPPPLQE